MLIVKRTLYVTGRPLRVLSPSQKDDFRDVQQYQGGSVQGRLLLISKMKGHSPLHRIFHG
jgi:hypothetical protein